jgi:hypothetical protein
MQRRIIALAACLGLLTAGCPNTDAAVFVEASIEGMEATVEQSSLTTGIGGSFTLVLHLGPRADDASAIDINQLSFTNADRTTTVLEPLKFSTDSTLPVQVGIDSDVRVNVTFVPDGADGNLVDSSDMLCDPAGIAVAGSLSASLRGSNIPVHSLPFQPTCP